MSMFGTIRPSLTIAVAALAIAGLTGAASAKVLKASTYPANFAFTTATASVPLGTGPVTTVAVRAPSAGTYSLTFSAECSVDAPADNTGAWVDLDVIVNGATVSPTVGSSDAFCAADGVAGYSSWVRPSITVAVDLDKGRNDVQIRARLNGATGAWISDSSLVIDD